MLRLVLIETRNDSYHEITQNRILNRFFELNSVENKMSSLNSKAQAVNKARRQLRLESYFRDFLNRRLR